MSMALCMCTEPPFHLHYRNNCLRGLPDCGLAHLLYHRQCDPSKAQISPLHSSQTTPSLPPQFSIAYQGTSDAVAWRSRTHGVACGWLCLLAASSPVFYVNTHGSPQAPCCFSPPGLCSRILSAHILPLPFRPLGYMSPCTFGQSLCTLDFLATRRVSVLQLIWCVFLPLPFSMFCS